VSLERGDRSQFLIGVRSSIKKALLEVRFIEIAHFGKGLLGAISKQTIMAPRAKEFAAVAMRENSSRSTSVDSCFPCF
jgi:hypothetical protein